MPKFLEEIALTGPKDIYELVCLVNDAEETAEFLVRECQEKDRKILLLSRILERELGHGFWQQYAMDVLNMRVPPAETLGPFCYVPGVKIEQKPMAPEDIPF